MKRALAILAVCALFSGFALGQTFSGKWSLTLNLLPNGLVCSDAVPAISVSSSLTLSYIYCDWTFSSISAFSQAGFTSQQFTASGGWGAFSISSTMKFIPAAVTVYTNKYQTGSDCCYWTSVAKEFEPKFDDWKTTLSFDFAGVNVEFLTLLEQGNYDKTYEGFFELNGEYSVGTFTWDETQTQSTCTTYKNGLGWRMKLASMVGSCNFSLYAYFGLSEWSLEAYQAYLNAVYGGYSTDLSLAKSGYIVMANDDCNPGFSELYLLMEDLALGCATLDAALTITCSGFSSFAVLLDDLPLICCGITTDVKVTFDINSKTVVWKPKFSYEYACIVFDVGVAYGSGSITGLDIYGFSLSAELSDCLKVVFDTSFNTSKHPIANPIYGGDSYWFYIPATTLCTGTNDTLTLVLESRTKDTTTYYEIVGDGEDDKFKITCLDEIKYTIWEKISFSTCLPGCCGGEVKFTVDTFFGDKYVLEDYGFAYYDGSHWAFYVSEDLSSFAAKTADEWKAWYSTATGSTWSASPTKEALYTVPYYKAATTNDNLFGWVKTTIKLVVPMSANISITSSFDVSMFGFDKVDLGFSITF